MRFTSDTSVGTANNTQFSETFFMLFASYTVTRVCVFSLEDSE